MAVRSKRKVRIDPDKIYIATAAFVGGEIVVREGQRLRGSHEAVQLAPGMFVPDGADDAEIAAARSEMLDFLDEPPQADTRIQLPGQLTAEHPHALVVTADAHFTLEDGSLVRVREGDLVDDREAWVVKARKARGGVFR